MSDDDDDNIPIPPMLQEDADATMYKYRDFASIPDDALQESSTTTNNRSLESSIRVQKFPVKLYAILAQKEFGDIITWMPHGRSWKVLKPNLFETLVMPLFFEYSNYHSFNRLVNAWSFRRVSSGPDRGSYYHEVRSLPLSIKFMDHSNI
jgi:HSF-type DNA-binding